VYGKPGMPEQPGSAGTDKFLRLGSRVSSNNTKYQTRLTAFQLFYCSKVGLGGIENSMLRYSMEKISQYN